MTVHIQLKINDEAGMKLALALKTTTDQLGRVFKASILNEEGSKYYRSSLFNTKPEVIKSDQEIIDQYLITHNAVEIMMETTKAENRAVKFKPE